MPRRKLSHITRFCISLCSSKRCCYRFPIHVLYPEIACKRLCKSINSFISLSRHLILSFCAENVGKDETSKDNYADSVLKSEIFTQKYTSDPNSFNAFDYDVKSKLDKIKMQSRGFSTNRNCFIITRRQYSDRVMKENDLHLSKTSRAIQITDLAVGMITGAIFDTFKRVYKGQPASWADSFLSESNMVKFTDTICKMRGVPLKLCQFLSIQHDLLPQPLLNALANTRNRADFMSQKQVVEILTNEFGVSWRDKFDEFDLAPIASASIGQVHLASFKNKKVAVKIQFPGISESITSDIDNFVNLCSSLRLVPKSMFINIFGREIKSELYAECNYLNEAEFYRIFKQLLMDFEGFYVPDTFPELTTKNVLTTEFVQGIPLDQAIGLISQEKRNAIGTKLLKLVLNELFTFQLMNTDPNPGNFLYDLGNDTINLIDFGAVRCYKNNFIDDYKEIVKASITGDVDRIRELSFSLGFLCDKDSKEMIDTHVSSVSLIGVPLKEDEYDFSNNEIIENIRLKAAKMMRIRKNPPPPEVYTLHRKLAGCYLICHKMSAHINTRYAKELLFNTN